LTFRPAEQGGFREIGKDERVEFWKQVALWRENNHANDFVDIEAELLTDVPELIDQLRSDRIICSHHDFHGVPENLEQFYERMTGTRAAVLKVAVQADDALDCLPIFKLLDRAQGESREMIAIAMGPSGVATRILGPSRGSFLT